MILPDILIELARKFHKDTPLYLVGGAVRNSIMGLPFGDFDIAAAVKTEELKELLEGSGFKIVGEYSRTGTMVLNKSCHNFEYTTFRVDSYPIGSGCHQPAEVRFTADLREDAGRRDFTCNAIYYDILKEKFIDPFGGISDINNRLLRVIASKTLEEDALRILRLVRLSCELGLRVEDKTLEMAATNCYKLKDIAPERIREELDKILIADTKYPDFSTISPIDGVRLTVKIGAMEYIIPELTKGIGCNQNPLYHIYDVFDHTLSAMGYAPPHLRKVALFHDIAKPYVQEKYGNHYGHDVYGAEIAVAIMRRLKYPNDEINYVKKLVGIHMFNLDGKTKPSKIRKFIADNYEYFEDFLTLRYCDIKASKKNENCSINKMIEIRNQMISEKLPLTIKELPVNGNDLKDIGMKGPEIGAALNRIREHIIMKNKVMNRDEIMEMVRRKI